jgi:DNA polymerase III subunit epsilon
MEWTATNLIVQALAGFAGAHCAAAALQDHRFGAIGHSLVGLGASALAVLLDQARKKTIRGWAEQSSFDLKDVLKRRGYRWCYGSDGRPDHGTSTSGKDQLGNEIAFLKTEIYLSEVEPRLQTLTALSRFSIRA